MGLWARLGGGDRVDRVTVGRWRRLWDGQEAAEADELALAGGAVPEVQARGGQVVAAEDGLQAAQFAQVGWRRRRVDGVIGATAAADHAVRPSSCFGIARSVAVTRSARVACAATIVVRQPPQAGGTRTIEWTSVTIM